MLSLIFKRVYFSEFHILRYTQKLEMMSTWFCAILVAVAWSVLKLWRPPHPPVAGGKKAHSEYIGLKAICRASNRSSTHDALRASPPWHLYCRLSDRSTFRIVKKWSCPVFDLLRSVHHITFIWGLGKGKFFLFEPPYYNTFSLSSKYCIKYCF